MSSKQLFLWIYLRCWNLTIWLQEQRAVEVNAKINSKPKRAFKNSKLISSLTLMSLALCKTHITLRIPEEIKRVFNPEI